MKQYVLFDQNQSKYDLHLCDYRPYELFLRVVNPYPETLHSQSVDNQLVGLIRKTQNSHDDIACLQTSPYARG